MDKYLNDQYFMKIAIKMAEDAWKSGDAPVGAVVVKDGIVIGKAGSRSIISENPIKHAEILALEMAGIRIGCRKLFETTIYVTMEPCPMCAGAIYQSRISRLVYGIRNPKIEKAKALPLPTLISPQNSKLLQTKHTDESLIFKPQYSLVDDLYMTLKQNGYKHKVKTTGGIMADTCRKMWMSFFEQRNNLKRK